MKMTSIWKLLTNCMQNQSDSVSHELKPFAYKNGKKIEFDINDISKQEFKKKYSIKNNLIKSEKVFWEKIIFRLNLKERREKKKRDRKAKSNDSEWWELLLPKGHELEKQRMIGRH